MTFFQSLLFSRTLRIPPSCAIKRDKLRVTDSLHWPSPRVRICTDILRKKNATCYNLQVINYLIRLRFHKIIFHVTVYYNRARETREAVKLIIVKHYAAHSRLEVLLRSHLMRKRQTLWCILLYIYIDEFIIEKTTVPL